MAVTTMIQFYPNEYACSSYGEVRYTRIILLEATDLNLDLSIRHLLEYAQEFLPTKYIL
jgi:hypothetical protein